MSVIKNCLGRLDPRYPHTSRSVVRYITQGDFTLCGVIEHRLRRFDSRRNCLDVRSHHPFFPQNFHQK